MSGEQPFLQEAVEQLNRFQEEHDRGVKVTSVKVSASEKVSTGDYENYSPHSAMEADVFLAESWEEQREDLLETLLEQSSTRGDAVLDPFLGSGSTAVAAIRSERDCVGFEIDADTYRQVIERRVAEAERQLEASINAE